MSLSGTVLSGGKSETRERTGNDFYATPVVATEELLRSRKALFERSPLKAVYVFSGRVSPWRDGEPLDERGRPWASTMCFAWFVWDKRYTGEPVIRWI